MVTDHFQLSPANVEARFQALQARRVRRPDADDPLFRPVDADDFRINGAAASDFSNLRQNALVTDQLPAAAEREARRSGHQPALGRDLGGRLADGSERERREAHRRRRHEPVVPRSEQDGRIPVGRARGQPPGPGARRPRQSRADPERRLRSGSWTTWPRSSGCCSRRAACAGWPRPSGEGPTPLPDPDPPLSALEQQGKAVFARSCAQCHGGPGPRPRRPGSSDSTTSRRSARVRWTR